jgi:hypothetical protein
MNKLKFVIAAGLLAATAACTQTGYDNSYAYNSGYYAQNTSARYGYQNRRGPHGDYDGDGVPNSRDIDANGDHVPDAFQR